MVDTTFEVACIKELLEALNPEQHNGNVLAVVISSPLGRIS